MFTDVDALSSSGGLSGRTDSVSQSVFTHLQVSVSGYQSRVHPLLSVYTLLRLGEENAIIVVAVVTF